MALTADETNTILPGVIEILSQTGKLDQLSPDEDFYDAGITSVMALPILLDIEDRYEVSIPDSVFVSARTANALAEIIAGLRQG